MGLDHQDTEAKSKPALAFNDLKGHLLACQQGLRSFLLAVFVIYWIHGGDDGYGYPAYGRAAEWNISWMWPIILRNLIGYYSNAGGIDYIFQFSSLAPYFAPYKLYPEYPTLNQLKHDAFVGTGATLCGSALEILICHHMAIGNLSFDRNLMDNPLKSAFWAFFLAHIREPHFYLTHRIMHPWRTKYFPDLGRWMYVYIHSRHHKSFNTTAFSGTNMHPIEATLYYSSCCIALPFGCHPAMFLAILLEDGIAAWQGHGGYLFPGNGNHRH